MRLPGFRDRTELLWRSGDRGPAPSRRFPGLVLAVTLGLLAALYPAVLPVRLLSAFLSGLFAGVALPALVRRCPRCKALAPPLGSRYCGRCGTPLAF